MRAAPMPFYVAVGQRIRNARRAMGFSQDDLAVCIGAKSGHAIVSEIESGRTQISLHTFLAIADALGTDIQSLLREE